MKKFISLALALCLCTALSAPAFADSSVQTATILVSPDKQEISTTMHDYALEDEIEPYGIEQCGSSPNGQHAWKYTGYTKYEHKNYGSYCACSIFGEFVCNYCNEQDWRLSQKFNHIPGNGYYCPF